MELKEDISASHHSNTGSLKGDTTMFTKIALAAALIAGTASVAFAEGDSTIGIYGPYGQGVQQRSAPVRQYAAPRFKNRNVSLGAGQATTRAPQGAAQDWFTIDVQDHASSPYAGGGF
jgi:hypothetical protein